MLSLNERVAKAVHDLRRTSMPLSDLIPLLQELSDAINQKEKKFLCQECNDSGEIETGIGMMTCTYCPFVAHVQKPVAWLYEAEYSSGSYSGSYFRWRVTANKFDTSGAREIKPLYTTPPAAPVPDAITDNSESPEYKAGWNECRELTIQMRKS